MSRITKYEANLCAYLDGSCTTRRGYLSPDFLAQTPKVDSKSLQLEKDLFRNRYTAVSVPESFVEKELEIAKERGFTGPEAQRVAKVNALYEWVALHCWYFYATTRVLYSTVAKYHEETYRGPAQGFPPGCNYRFPARKTRNGSSYVKAVFSWVKELFSDPAVFPANDKDPFPADFIDGYAKPIMKRLFRVCAIMCTRCHPMLEQQHAASIFVRQFRWLYYFGMR